MGWSILMWWRPRAGLVLGALVLLFGCRPAQPLTTPPQLLHTGTGLYPRLIRLAHSAEANNHIIGSIVSFHGNTGVGLIFESRDDGRTFEQIGTVADPDAAGGQGLCCATLYELPTSVGTLSAGTLLWAASVGQDEPERRMALRIWRSTNGGRAWSYLSSCAVAANTGGLWEPELSVADDGALVCHYADETDARSSQKLVRVRSRDGIAWTDLQDTVRGTTPADRPGMPVVRPLADGSFIMSYEVCPAAGVYRCAAYMRRSPDGWDWGEPTEFGVRAETADGQYVTHAPNLTWSAQGSENGTLLVVGQLLERADGTAAQGSGATILRNTNNGEGAWTTMPAPVPVPEAYDNYCPNYSSALLATDNGRSVLEVATKYDGPECKAYFAIGAR